jgi:hypothetical protein
MTGRELIAHLRESVLDDISIPYLWPDAELLRFLNYAEVQACRRAHLIIDSTTANDSGTAGTASTMGVQALCRLTVIADQATYTLSNKVLQVRRCQLQSMAYALPKSPAHYAEMDELIPDWFGTSGTVSTAGPGGYPDLYLNEPGNTITFVRAPGSNDTAFLSISRLPLVTFGLLTSPEIDERYHINICDWAAHLAFMKPDSETINLQMAKYYEDRFTSVFGPLPDAYSERMRKTLNQQTRMRPRQFGD